MTRGEPNIRLYEGLVFKTAEIFASMVGLELEDMQQELRIKVVAAIRAHDPARSKMSERAFVYGCVANCVKDMKRAAARRSKLRFQYIEDYARSNSNSTDNSTDWFEYHFQSLPREQVYAAIEDSFVLPSTITDEERQVLLLLVVGLEQKEIAVELQLSDAQVHLRVKSLRTKFADWRPTPETPVRVPVAA